MSGQSHAKTCPYPFPAGERIQARKSPLQTSYRDPKRRPLWLAPIPSRSSFCRMVHLLSTMIGRGVVHGYHSFITRRSRPSFLRNSDPIPCLLATFQTSNTSGRSPWPSNHFPARAPERRCEIPVTPLELLSDGQTIRTIDRSS